MTDVHYLTPEGLKKLEDELHTLITIDRPAVSERIQRAKEFGDLSENAEYSEAKEQQAFIEGKIIELKNIIKSAVIISPKKSDGTVRVGSKINVQMPDQSLKQFEIVGSREADPAAGRISNESPMGNAFIGRRAGDTVTIDTPRGKITCTIVEIL